MGMDVVGVRPSAEVGKYFRNNVWWWGPLWSYCVDVAPQLCDGVDGWTNDGDGLPESRALALASLLEKSILDGRCERRREQFEAEKTALPKEPCRFCEGTGVRRDRIGETGGMTTRELSPEQAGRVGRESGWCNGCDGEGIAAQIGSWYCFDTANVKEFISFLKHCGGFKIW